MARIIGSLLVGILILCAVTGSAQSGADTAIDPAELQQVLALLNKSIDDAIAGATYDEISEALQAFDDAFVDFFSMLPTINGLPFMTWADLARALEDTFVMGDRLSEDMSQGDIDNLREALNDAKSLKDQFEGFLAESQVPCPNGTTLITVYPGFDPHSLRSTVNEELQQGKCVKVTWGVPQAYYDIVPGLDPDAAMKQLVYSALGTSYTGNPDFAITPVVDEDLQPSTVIALGDFQSTPRTPQTPGTPDSNYGRSTLASGTQAGEPIGLGPTPTLMPGDDAGIWVQLEDVCSPMSADMKVGSQGGMFNAAYTYGVDPDDAGVDCFSTASSMNFFDLWDTGFWLPGEYWVEVWVNDVYSANHTFTVQPPQVPPYVYGESYTYMPGVPLSGNVLDNDYDINGDPLTARLVTPPDFWEFVFQPDGSFEYVPGPDDALPSSFVYEVSDGYNEPIMGTGYFVPTPLDD